MSKESQSNKDKPSHKASDFAKHIWLAGLGAYGKAFEEVSGRYDKATRDSPKLFRELAAKGAKLENETKEKLTKSKLGKSGASLEQRIQKMRDTMSFSFPHAVSHDDIERIEAKLDNLIKDIAKLSKVVGANSKPAKKKITVSRAKKSAPK